MANPLEKIEKIKQFINEYIENTKVRGKMYGGISELEAKWIVLDYIYFILEDIFDEHNNFYWGDFLASKGFGAKSASLVIKEMNPIDPYLELNKLRNEYEEWRTAKISQIKTTL